jgi:histidinol-phosphate phosphatase family protein
MKGRRAVFLDKDGTILENVPFNVDPRAMRWLPGAAAGLRLLHEAGFVLVVVSNQSGVALGRFPESALDQVGSRLSELTAAVGARLGGFYYCPHDPEATASAFGGSCLCRKPMPGLLYRAASDLELDLAQSWAIGDILHDVEAGNRAGCRTVLLNNGGETEWKLGPFRRPTFDAPDLAVAARRLISLTKVA